MTGHGERDGARGGGPNDRHEPEGEEVVGLVIAGAAARGPYTAGALAELIPALREEYGDCPLVLLGTSSGALNAGLLAQFADEGDQAGERVVEAWLGITSDHVFTNAYLTLIPDAVRLGLGLVRGAPVGRISGLLDTRPLRGLAKEMFQPERVARNVAAGRVRSVGVAATWCPPNGIASRTRIFLQGQQPTQNLLDHAVDVVEARLEEQHLRASAAIPAIFPPVEITTDGVSGTYIDGGVRLNAPLLPALRLNVTRLVVVSSFSVTYPPAPAGSHPLDLETSAAISLRAVLADALADDLRRLVRRNTLALSGKGTPPYRRIPYRSVAPQDGELARMAADCFRNQQRSPFSSNALIGRLLSAAGQGIGHDELLSFILFDPDYTEKQIALGREHARTAIKGGWLT